MNPNQLLYAGGLTICGLVVLQLLVRVASSVHTAMMHRRKLQLEMQVLSREIDSIRLQSPSPDRPAWFGFRKFRVHWKVRECEDCSSLYLVPHDGKPLPPFRPGQYLTLSMRMPGQPRPTVRCYSLSDRSHPDHYRITVQKVSREAQWADRGAGSASAFLVDQIAEGEILDVKAPGGSFCLDQDSNRPVVLIAGGIGITPLLSMLSSLASEEFRRPVYLFWGIRHVAVQPFREYLAGMAVNHPWMEMHICYSQSAPPAGDKGIHPHSGRLDLQLLRSLLPTPECDFYLCGPPSLLHDLTTGLRNWGVPTDFIHVESFGPASVKSVSARPPATGEPAVQVSFTRSHLVVTWTPKNESLLELAESLGVSIESGCRAGNCGTCLTAVTSGAVRYTHEVANRPEPGLCLPCVCVPDGPVTLDA